ncbi:hypothetical protein CYMTET_24288 [Cymbomonas tetramitiformis]|uniref:Uncharacterized protein n=1 Tax=Cymbomonas tetramitiformis TaxID=36881 RepID=A0AAE0L0D8_9CHLO|nr:hypothetical protein CYMTET_24288 [Cymbomonas tetramitiformis]|eukprot:gene23799-28853_t
MASHVHELRHKVHYLTRHQQKYDKCAEIFKEHGLPNGVDDMIEAISSGKLPVDCPRYDMARLQIAHCLLKDGRQIGTLITPRLRYIFDVAHSLPCSASFFRVLRGAGFLHCNGDMDVSKYRGAIALPTTRGMRDRFLKKGKHNVSIGFLWDAVRDHVNTHAPLQEKLSDKTLLTDAVHWDETDGEPVLGDKGAIDYGGLEQSLGLGVPHLKLRQQTEELSTYCYSLLERIEATIRAEGDVAMLTNEIRALLSSSAVLLSQNTCRLLHEVEERTAYRDKKKAGRQTSMAARATQLRQKAGQHDDTAEVISDVF